MRSKRLAAFLVPALVLMLALPSPACAGTLLQGGTLI
jgi:hypothetical protein